MFDKVKEWCRSLFISSNSDFNIDVKKLLKDEGGLTNDPNDPGGITKYGISIRFLKEIGMKFNGQNPKPQDIINLTQEDAEKFYKIYFWDKLNISSLKNPIIENKVFNLAVNMGGQTAIKLLQRAINMNSRDLLNLIYVDGIIGKNTINSVRRLNTSVLMNDYRRLASLYYEKLVDKNPKLNVFLKGWLKRAQE